MDSATQVQILNKAVCISHNGHTLEKGIFPSILLPVVDKIVGQHRLFYLDMATSLGEGKLLIQTY